MEGVLEAVSEATQLVLPSRLHLIGGLRPFTQAADFDLYVETDAPPFLRIEAVSVNLAYVLVEPMVVWSNYVPDFVATDLDEVGITPDQPPLVLAIVNLSKGPEQATANLAGPLLINPSTGKGKQVVLQNAMRYSCRQSLLAERL